MNLFLPAAIEKALDGLNEDQLRSLNRIVIERLRQINRVRQIKSMAKFRIADRVFFDHHGKRLIGTIIRLNQKTVTVHTEDGHQWNVAPVFLHQLYESVSGDDVRILEVNPPSRNALCPCGSGKKFKRCCIKKFFQ